VREEFADPAQWVWVAEDNATPIGFVAARLDSDSGLGEIEMIAVDPDTQGRGLVRLWADA